MAKTDEDSLSLSLHHVSLAGPGSQASLPWHTLPNELKIKVMRQLVPFSVSITDYSSTPGQATRRPDNEPWASRQALAVACLASRELKTICKPLLYEAVALKDCRELLCLLRTLAIDPGLRSWVRRFAWVNLIRNVDVNQPIVEMGPELDGLLVEFSAIWPRTGRDNMLSELFQLRTTDLASFSLWKVLGVVVATLRHVRTLFLTHGGPQLDSRGQEYHAEHDAIAHLLSPALLPASELWYTVTRPDIDRADPTGSAARIHQQDRRHFLMLEEIIIDTCDRAQDYTAAIKTPWTLWFLILNCPRLRRVELKGTTGFWAILDPVLLRNSNRNQPERPLIAPRNLLLLPQPVGAKVQKLVMHRLEWAHWEIMQNIFPNLERLVTVFQHGDWRCRRRRPQRPDKLINIVPDLGRSITLWQGTLRSLTLTGFFSSNGKMLGNGYHDNLLLGYRWLIVDMPPFLSPGLPQVPLTELTTDCVWLFGRVDPSVAFQIPSLIPSSLVSLHLIDYWAVPIDEEVFEEGEWLRYYPAFPSGLTPLGFLDKVFSILHDSCATEHARLEHITLSSPLFDVDSRWSTPDTRLADMADVQAWQATVRDKFSRIGVRFSFTTMMKLETSIQSSWAHV